MANVLTLTAKEGSSYTVKAQFYSKVSDGSEPSPVVPNEGLSWTLKDENDNVVNERLNVPIDTGEFVIITLHGDDLALSGDYSEKRYLTIEGTYDSVLEQGLELVDQVEFVVENLKG